jgi:hypothetical protein
MPSGALINASPLPNVPERGIILLEGTRRLPPTLHPQLRRLAHWLCATYPQAIFRSGNATGSDEVFAAAVAECDPARLELVVPNHAMGRKRRPPGCRCVSLDELPEDELRRAADVTRQASPASGRLAEYYVRTRGGPSSPASGKGMYLLRDTIKVTGSPSAGLAPASFGIFYVDAAAPHGGGTGHTIRVCQIQSVPVAPQAEWSGW